MHTFMYILRFPASSTMLRSRTWSRIRYMNQSVLQCVAVCCSVLQCVAVCCSVLQCVAVCCSVARGVVWCSVLQCVAVCCSVLHCREHDTSTQDGARSPSDKSAGKIYIWNENKIRTHEFIVCTYSDSSGICAGEMQESKECVAVCC